MAQGAREGHHRGNVDSKRTVHGTTFAHGALQPKHLKALLKKGLIKVPLATIHLAQRRFDFVGRTQSRITIIGKVNETAFSAETATCADTKPSSNPGTIIGPQQTPHLIFVNPGGRNRKGVFRFGIGI